MLCICQQERRNASVQKSILEKLPPTKTRGALASVRSCWCQWTKPKLSARSMSKPAGVMQDDGSRRAHFLCNARSRPDIDSMGKDGSSDGSALETGFMHLHDNLKTTLARQSSANFLRPADVLSNHVIRMETPARRWQSLYHVRDSK